MAELRSITEAFAHDDPNCPACKGIGTVCEQHGLPWEAGDLIGDDPTNSAHWNDCAGPGEPCPVFMAEHS
jgi:hypothetical protein